MSSSSLVLDLFIEYVPRVITESFTISIYIPVILRLLIDAIAQLEHRVSGWFNQRGGLVWRALRLVTMFSLLFFSKFHTCVYRRRFGRGLCHPRERRLDARRPRASDDDDYVGLVADDVDHLGASW